MAAFGIPALALLLGLIGGWVLGRRAGRAARPVPADLSRLTHDVRGALSPAMLMAERLERHSDAGVRQTAEVIVRALERTAALCRDASAAAKQSGS